MTSIVYNNIDTSRQQFYDIDAHSPQQHGHYYQKTAKPRKYSNDHLVDAYPNYKQRPSPVHLGKQRGPKPSNYNQVYGPVYPPPTQFLPDDFHNRKCIYVKKNEYGPGPMGKEEPERLSAYSTNSSDEDAQGKTRRSLKEYVIYFNGENISQEKNNRSNVREKGIIYTRKIFGASEFKQEPESLADVPIPSFAL